MEWPRARIQQLEPVREIDPCFSSCGRDARAPAQSDVGALMLGILGRTPGADLFLVLGDALPNLRSVLAGAGKFL